MAKRLTLLTAAAPVFALTLTACATIAAQDEAAVARLMVAGDTLPPDIAPAAIPAPKTEQWLYGSAEAQIALRQGWDSIAAYGEYVAQNRPAAARYMISYTPEVMTLDNCGAKPMAAVFDADETVIWNLGVTRYQSERGKGFDPDIWDQWEETGARQVVAVPGAVAAFDRLRASGITIIINTNRDSKHAAATADALRHAGLGEFQHGSTLYLKGDGVPAGEKPSSAKDGRRAMIAKDYCIVILAGDQLGDISDVFNAKGPDGKAMSAPERRALVNAPAFDRLWGKGWFILPNPIYGPWEGAGFDDIYPADTSWKPSATTQP